MAKTGRPKTEVPMAVVDAACQFNPSIAQVIEVLRGQGHTVSRETLKRAIKTEHGLTFELYRDQKTEGTRLKLVQKAVKMALDGNATMLIFCLKNMVKWADKPALTVETEDEAEKPDMKVFSNDQLIELALRRQKTEKQ